LSVPEQQQARGTTVLHRLSTASRRPEAEAAETLTLVSQPKAEALAAVDRPETAELLSSMAEQETPLPQLRLREKMAVTVATGLRSPLAVAAVQVNPEGTPEQQHQETAETARHPLSPVLLSSMQVVVEVERLVALAG
jgi:hypothetical protein